MTEQKPAYRKRHLFPRTLGDVVKQATKPMMDKKGKLYGALIAEWPKIVGPERAKICRPQRLQFPQKEATGATLHLDVHPAETPALQYETGQLIEQCARFFGYRAIERIVLHSSHEMLTASLPKPTEIQPPPKDMRELLQRVKSRIMSESSHQ